MWAPPQARGPGLLLAAAACLPRAELRACCNTSNAQQDDGIDRRGFRAGGARPHLAAVVGTAPRKKRDTPCIPSQCLGFCQLL